MESTPDSSGRTIQGIPLIGDSLGRGNPALTAGLTLYPYRPNPGPDLR